MNEHLSSNNQRHDGSQENDSLLSQYERFDHQTYQRIQHELRSGDIGKVDHTALIQQMKQEGNRPSPNRFFSIRSLFNHPLQYVYSTAAVCIAMFVILIVWHWMPTPASTIQFISNNNQEVQVPFLWQSQLQMGFSVIVPSDVRAVIQLNEGSEIQCAPGTQLSIHVDHNRIIQMDVGHILVSAAHIEESQMKVKTQLFDVVVVGTEFEVELTSKQ